jgi:hypothetical protein
MGKKLSLALIGLVFFFTYSPALAGTGMCSDHGGPNCSVGPASNGGTICNDGYVSDMHYYYATPECVKGLHFCSQSEFVELSHKNNLDVLGPAAYLAQHTENAKATADAYGAGFSKTYEQCYALGAQTYAANTPPTPPEPDPIEICTKKLGVHGVVSGQNTCGCSEGYTLDSQKTSCVTIQSPAPAQIVPVREDAKPNEPMGQGPLPGTLEDEKQRAVSTSTAIGVSETAVQVSIQEKSLWKKIIGWFNWNSIIRWFHF